MLILEILMSLSPNLCSNQLKLVAQSVLKAFADDNLDVTEMIGLVLEWVENIV